MTEAEEQRNCEKPLAHRRGFFWETRTRIFSWYVALMSFFFILSIPIFYSLVFDQVDKRVREDLREEVEAFEEFVEAQNLESSANRNTTAALFDRFLSSLILEDDNFLLAFIDGQFYRSSPVALPKILQQDSQFIKRLAMLTEFEQGEKPTSDAGIGNLLYIVHPVIVNGEVQGILVAVHSTAGERREAEESMLVIIRVLLIMLAMAMLLAWLASKIVLLPLKAFNQVVREISESDLTQRLPVQGRGEMAELAAIFNAMMERLQIAFDSQRDFINDAGHEMRTPITIVRGHLELLDDDPLEQQKTVTLVIDELDRMSRLVNDLILLAKAERKDFLELKSFDVAVLTEELHAKARGLTSRNWQLEAKANGNLIADRQRITQAVMNLAENATQHTEATDTIALGSSIEGGQVRFWVRDTGEGIEPSEQQRIFQRFARAANSRRRSEGAGLGLSIVQAIARTHGGYVELYSQLDVGSNFALVIPLEPPKQPLTQKQHKH